ncbi:MAG: efflux RND transporter periplasmic adaptor subunit [Acidobacteriota bacterium]|nr:efflux RND transporter periplasmic adaptor subunit [Acidobacteriota bacterium]
MAVLLIVLLGIGAYLELRPRRIRVSVTKPATETISNAILTNGKVEPVHGFEAHAPQSLTVQKVLAHEGEQVKAGQLLLQLDDSHARSDVAAAEARLKGAEERYQALLAGGSAQELLTRRTDLAKTKTDVDAAQRQLDALQRLHDRGAATGDEVMAARARLTRAQADLSQLQATVRYSPDEKSRAQAEVADARAGLEAAASVLALCDVKAPFAGTVYYLPVKAGAYVSEGDLLLQEADLSQLQVRAFVDEPEIGRLGLGQEVKITWDALPSRTWEGHLATLPSTVINRGSRVVGEVLCAVSNGDRALLPGINVNATIVAASKPNVITVPREAVQDENGHRYVYVVNGKHLHKQEVKVGIANLTRVELVSGVSSSDTIAVQSYSPSPLSDGVEVRVVENPS